VRLPNLWHAVVIHKWPNRDLAVHLLQDFDDPNKPYRFAITGGTGDYQGAYGQVEYVSEQDITFRFSTPEQRSHRRAASRRAARRRAIACEEGAQPGQLAGPCSRARPPRAMSANRASSPPWAAIVASTSTQRWSIHSFPKP
jgi:hypothetical protein